ncbi:MAG TPA: hypothetical protein VKG44_04850 [Candidatus Baltobacteraceae bacterium]|nr:hypothetical protein [Candidatus Baltobacteraceae bacterium]
MQTTFYRVAVSCAVVLASTVCAMAAESDLAPATAALTTRLNSDDTFKNDAGKPAQRQLSIVYTARASGPCEVTVHREATSTYAYIGNIVPTMTDAVTFYMVPLDTMAKVTFANAKTSNQVGTYVSGSTKTAVYQYSEDTIVPLTGLVTTVEPVGVSSQTTPPRFPAFKDAAAAKAAIAALAKAAATCTAAPAAK